MIIIRIVLYLICVISIGWSILIFGGPPVIKRIISGYSNGAITPSEITVSPRLNISISRLDFNFKNRVDVPPIEGFSRGTEIAWSLFGNKPFFTINVGPSVLKDYASLKSIELYAPSFQEIDWQNIFLIANLEGLATGSFGKMHSLTAEGNLNFEYAMLSNVIIEAEKFNVFAGSPTYSAEIIRSEFSELNLSTPINKQLFSSTFDLENVTFPELGLTASEATLDVVLSEESRDLKINSYDVNLTEFGGFLKNVKVDGSFNQFNVLEDLQLDILDSYLSDKSPKFSGISVTVNKSEKERYNAKIEGDWGKFDLTHSDNYIGSLPGANFVLDADLDLAASKLTATLKINFNGLSNNAIFGSAEMGFRSALLKKLKCISVDCELQDFDLSYNVNFDEEWLTGSASCPEGFCSLTGLDHFVRTSNTVNIFTILNETKILSPLSSLYLYGAISSGQKINEGHELKFQF